MATHHIGTSGWSYQHWQDTFYPQGLPPGQRLAHYAAHLGSAEINNSFYSLPSVETLKHWRVGRCRQRLGGRGPRRLLLL